MDLADLRDGLDVVSIEPALRDGVPMRQLAGLGAGDLGLGREEAPRLGRGLHLDVKTAKSLRQFLQENGPYGGNIGSRFCAEIDKIQPRFERVRRRLHRHYCRSELFCTKNRA